MKTAARATVYALLLLLSSVISVRAQLVADGATRIINGTTSNVNGILDIGTNGSFTTLIITNGGAVTNVSFGNIGFNATSKSNLVFVTGSNSMWLASHVNVGAGGSFNQLIITNGGLVQSGGVGFGNSSTSGNNLAIVSGTTSLWDNTDGNLYIGEFSSSNRLVINNGGHVQSSTGSIGGNASLISTGNHNSALITDPGSQWVMNAQLYISDAGAFDELVVSNGALMQNSSCTVGIVPNSFSGSNNLVVVTGTNSLWKCTSDLQFGVDAPANQLIVSNAATLQAFSLTLGVNSTSTNNFINLERGNIFITNVAQNAKTDLRRGTLVFNSGTFIADILLLTNGGFSQMIFNGGTLQTRNTTNNTGSPLIIGNGVTLATLQLLGNGSHVFTSGLKISGNAVLKGSGTIIGNVTNTGGGTLSPGASIGAITINGSLILSGGSTNFFELNKASATNDNIAGLTAVTYGGTLQLTNLSGTLTNGDSFRLFNAASYAGAFSSLNPSTPATGLKWNTNALAVTGTLRVVSATSAPPVIRSAALLNRTNLLINATNGVAYDPVYLLTSTNITLPMANWTFRATNQFDAGGSVSFANLITSGELQRYFRLSVQ